MGEAAALQGWLAHARVTGAWCGLTRSSSLAFRNHSFAKNREFVCQTSSLLDDVVMWYGPRAYVATVLAESDSGRV